jgi:hypothetical protein
MRRHLRLIAVSHMSCLMKLCILRKTNVYSVERVSRIGSYHKIFTGAQIEKNRILTRVILDGSCFTLLSDIKVA